MTTTNFEIPTPDQLQGMAPSEIDTICADVAAEHCRAEAALAAIVDRLHTDNHERPHYVGRGRGRKTWTTDLVETIASLRNEVEAPGYTEFQFAYRTPAKNLATYETRRLLVLHLATVLNTYNAEHARRPWSRFFLVNTNGGHIHSSQRCQTCNRGGVPTNILWQPALSGLGEADAVKALGPILCTVCFPSAPLDWTVGKTKPAHCPGTHQTPVAGTVQRYGRSTYGQCPSCSDRPLVTMGGTLRAHAAKANDEN